MDLFIKYFLPENKNSVYRRVFQNQVTLDNGTKSQLFAYITMDSEVDTSYLSNVANFTWNSILDTYSEYNGAALQAVKRSLRSGIQKAQEVLKNNQEIVDKGIDFEVTILALVGGNMYVAFVGDHEVNLYRDETVNPVSQLLREHKVNAGSISVFPTDVISVSDESTDFTWDTPFALMTDLEESIDDDSLDMGVVFLSQSVDFDDLVNIDSETSPYDLLNSGDESLEDSALEEKIDENIAEDNKLDDNPDVDLDGDSNEKEHDDDENGEENGKEAIEKVTEKEKALKEINDKEEAEAKIDSESTSKNPKIQKALDIMQIAWVFIKKWTGIIWNALIKLTNKLSIIWGNIREYILAVLAKSFGNKPWYKRLVANFSQSQLGKTPSLGKIEVGGYKKKELQNKRGVIVILAFVAILVTVVGVNKTRQAKEIREIHETYLTYESSVNQLLDNAEDQLRSDQDAAIASLDEADNLIKSPTIDTSVISAEDSSALSDLKDRLLSIEDDLYNRVAVKEGQNMTKFMDGKLQLGPDTNPSDISIYRDPTLTEYLYVADKGEKALFWVSTATAKAKRASTGDVKLTAPLFVDTGSNGVFVYDSALGVVRAPFKDNSGELEVLQNLTGVSPDDFQVNDVTEMAIFTAADNVYLLSGQDQSILKATGNGSQTYNLPYTYYSSTDLSTATDLFADFSIYLTSAGASGLGVYQYNTTEGRLAKTGIQITAPSEPFQDVVAGYTGGGTDKYLYLFDRSDKRLMVFEKPTTDRHQNTILFIKEYVYRGDQESVWSNVSDFVVDSTEENAYILDGLNIWKLPL